MAWRYLIRPIRESSSFIVYDEGFREEVFRGTYIQCLTFMGALCERMPFERARAFAMGKLILP
jgi:hypothetical protein